MITRICTHERNNKSNKFYVIEGIKYKMFVFVTFDAYAEHTKCMQKRYHALEHYSFQTENKTEEKEKTILPMPKIKIENLDAYLSTEVSTRVERNYIRLCAELIPSYMYK